jgi:hypothetical protein
MEKNKDINEWVALISNKTFALKEQIWKKHETIVLDAYPSYWVKAKTLACL